MVEPATPRRLFDGVSPDQVVFGDTLGEGKSKTIQCRGRQTNSDCRCIRTRQDWLDEDQSVKEIRHQVDEKA